jgi:glycine betaine/proline transport system substrate-binding protein
MKFFKKLSSAAFFGSFLLATTANAGDCKARLGDFDWSSANIHTAIALLFLKKDMDVKFQ